MPPPQDVDIERTNCAFSHKWGCKCYKNNMKTNLSNCCNAELNIDFSPMGIAYKVCSKCWNPVSDLASPEDWENDLADLLDNGTPTEIRDFVRKLINKDK
jgi:hypothetical protein